MNQYINKNGVAVPPTTSDNTQKDLNNLPVGNVPLNAESAKQVTATERTAYEKKSAKGVSQNIPNGPLGMKFGAPPVPVVKPTSRTLVGHKNFTELAQQAMFMATNPDGPLSQKLVKLQQQKFTTPTTPEQAGKAIAAAIDTAIQGGAALQQNTLLAFMRLIVRNNGAALKSLQNMSNIQSDVQNDISKVQAAQCVAAEAAMKKAQAKMHKLGILKPIVAAIMVVVTAIAAVFTFGASLGLALVAAAMLAGFLYGGLHGGHGFNLTDAFNDAAMAGGIATGAGLLPKILITVGEIVSKAMVKMLLIKTADAAEQATAQAAVKSSMAKQLSDVIKRLDEELRKPRFGMHQAAKAPVAAGEEGETQAAVSGESTKESKKGILGMNKDIVRAVAAAGALSGVGQGIQGGVQYAANMAQLEAASSQGLLKLIQSLGKILQTSSETLSDTSQAIAESHQNALNVSQNVLQIQSETNLAMANKL